MKEISMASPKWPPLMRAEDVLDEDEYPEGDGRSERADTLEEIERLHAACAARRRWADYMSRWPIE